MIDYSRISPVTIECIQNFVHKRIPPRDFLYAVLTNNLLEAFATADSANTAAMADIVGYCYNKIPASCWGSREKVAAWLNNKQAHHEA